jgi:hypothetical protein
MRLALLLTLVVGCVNKPAWPERDGDRELRRNGVADATVERVVAGEPLDPEQYEDFGRIHDRNVAFLLARNPSLPVEKMEMYADAHDDFIRSGLARNPALPGSLIEKLFVDDSHTVWTGLAANPGLDAKTLIRLHDEKKMDWDWFAMNPACPPEVEKAFRDAHDDSAVKGLERTRSERRNRPVDRPVSK